MSIILPLLLALSTCTYGVLVQPPTSTYGVDSTASELIDHSRLDPYAAAQRIYHPRRLMVSVFFPTALQGDCESYNQSYMPPATSAVYDAMYDQYGLPSGVFGTLEMSFCRNNQSSNQAAFNTTFPTVLFSPGLGNSRLEYSGIAQSLASRGFIVVTIDHPYDACIVEYPNGSKVLAANITSDKQITFDLDVRVADTAFVLDMLESHALPDQLSQPVASWKKSAAPQKYVMYGHSLGGATAVAAMSTDPRIIGAINLDGTMFGSVVSHGVACPVMLFAHPNHTLATDSSWNTTWKNSANATRLELVLKGSAHGTFTDFPLLVDAINLSKHIRHKLDDLIGSLPGQLVDHILGRYLNAFLKFALANSGSAIPRRSQSSKVDVLKLIKNGTCA